MAKTSLAERLRFLSALPLICVILALAAMSIAALSGAQTTHAPAREKLFDVYQDLNPRTPERASPFHIIEIDRDSLEAIGPWPWPRTTLAELVERAGAAGARGAILVEPVDAPDPLSPTVISDFWLDDGARDEALAAQLAQLPDTDIQLADAIAETQGALSVAPGALTILSAPSAVAASAADWLNVTDSASLRAPKAALRFELNPALKNAGVIAIAGLPQDADGILRRTPLVWSLDGAPAPAVALEAARLAAGVQTIEITASPSTGRTDRNGGAARAIKLGDKTLALNEGGALRLYAPSKPSIATTSAVHVLTDAAPSRLMADKVVLIGRNADVGEALSLPFGVASPAEAHALFANQIIDGAGVRRPAWIGYLEALAVMICGSAAIMWAQRLAFWPSVMTAVVCAGLLFAGSYAAFVLQGLLINPIAAASAFFLGSLTIAGGRELGVALRDDAGQNALAQSIPDEAMKKLRETDGREILAGARRPITVLACELSLTPDDYKKLRNTPEDIAAMMAAASNALRKSIIAAGGAADQADGGRLFAYFNAPMKSADHMDAACAGALRLVESMDKINAELDGSALTSGVQLRLAIGVATGECLVGAMGHGRANRYSAIGEAVDMAAFLRNQAHIYGPAIMCDETIYRQTHHKYAFLEMDRIRTSRRNDAMNVFALVGNPFLKSSKSFRTLDDMHRQLLIAYRGGDWVSARTLLPKIRQMPGASIALFDIYEARIDEMTKAGQQPDDWDNTETVPI